MAGVNKVILVGNLGKDPEVRSFENNKKAGFTLATSDSYKNKQGERVTNTEWHNVVLWGNLADIAEKYLNKGSQVYIEGKLTHRSYEDKEGVTKYITEVVGRELTLLGKKSDGDYNDSNASNQERSPAPSVDQDMEDDLPF